MINKKKRKLWTASILVILILLPILITMANNKTEQQTYRVVHTEKEFEIRFYPSATMASVTSSLSSYKEMANPSFRKLANYIFGGNQSKQSIAMTAPVHMNINDSSSSMSFVMPSGYKKENLPLPNDPGIKIQTSPEEYVAAIRFGGYASDHAIKKYSEKLEKLLKERGIEYEGNFRYLGYNSPFKIIGRRNEIIVRVNWTEKK